MARLTDTATDREVFNAVADGIARMSNVAFNLCTPNGSPYDKLTGYDNARVKECAFKAHKLAVLLSKLSSDDPPDRVAAIIAFNDVNP